MGVWGFRGLGYGSLGFSGLGFRISGSEYFDSSSYLPPT